MNTRIATVLLAASVLALSACKNETPTAQQEAAEGAHTPAHEPELRVVHHERDHVQAELGQRGELLHVHEQ